MGQHHLAIAALALAAAACDLCQKPKADQTATTSTGSIEVVLHQRGSCGTSLCTLAGWGRVQVLPAGGATPVHDTYFLDTIRLEVPAGSYDLVVAPDGAPVDRGVEGVAIGPGLGLRLERSYWSDLDVTLLALHFAPGTEARKAEVLADLGAAELAVTQPPAAFPEVRVRLGYRDHPQLAGERAVARFPGVVLGFRTNGFCGPGYWYEVTPGDPDGSHHHHDHWD